MNCVRILVDFVGIMLELYFTTILFGSLWKKKEGVPWIVVYLVFAIVVCTATYCPMFKAWNAIILPGLLLCLTYFYETRWLSRVFYALFIHIGLVLTEMVVGLAMTFILGGSVEQNIGKLSFYTCGVIFSKFIMYMIIRIFVARKERKPYAGFMTKLPQMIILSIVTTYVTLVILFLSYDSNSDFVILLTVLTVLLLIAANILIFSFSDKVLQQEMKLQRLTFAEERLKQQEEYYKEIVAKQREIARIRHDMNNYLISLSGYIEEGKKEQALEKISQQLVNIRTDEGIQCEDPCMAALLNVKYRIIREQKIKFDYLIQIPAKTAVDETDLCIIVGNLLDNAIEACCRFKESEYRKMSLKIVLDGDYIVIYIVNAVCKGYEPRADGRTLKAKLEEHGFGKENIQLTAEKYSGNADFRYEDGMFIATVLLKNE